jgi:hypothetical protein
MIELNASDFYDAVSSLLQSQGYLVSEREHAGSIFHEDKLPSALIISTMMKRLEDLKKNLQALDVPMTILACERLLKKASEEEKPSLTWKEIYRLMDHIHNRLYDELGLRKIFVLEENKRKYFETKEPHFGMEFNSKFPSAVYDLDEAANCLTFGRSTAAVFHLMRVMEIGVRAFATCLGIPDPIKPVERNWGLLLNNIHDGIQKKWPSAAGRMHGDAPLFESLYVSLDAVKNPWRNGTMHVENKYTDEEAEHIFMAVKGFMKKLASRCDERGLPLA